MAHHHVSVISPRSHKKHWTFTKCFHRILFLCHLVNWAPRFFTISSIAVLFRVFSAFPFVCYSLYSNSIVFSTAFSPPAAFMCISRALCREWIHISLICSVLSPVEAVDFNFYRSGEIVNCLRVLVCSPECFFPLVDTAL